MKVTSEILSIHIRKFWEALKVTHHLCHAVYVQIKRFMSRSKDERGLG